MDAATSPPGGGLRELLVAPGRFTVLTEVVPWRGALDDDAGERTRAFAADLRGVPGVDVVSVTDGAGGRLVLSPETLAADLAAAGQRVLVHVTCRDRNRNELAALAWRLAGQGLRDLLVLSGDYPHEGYLGVAKPVFDLDSVSLLQMYTGLGDPVTGAHLLGRRPARSADRSIDDLAPAPAVRGPLSRVPLHLGAAVNPYKTQARDAVPQYLKLELKARAGARFAITQSGFDVRRLHELSRYVADHELPLRLIAGVYVLTAGSARAFHAGRVPGVSLPAELLAVVERQATSLDKGKAFFLAFAAKQLAVARGLGYAGGCVSGLARAEDVATVLRLAEDIGGGWRDVVHEVTWDGPDEYWLDPPDGDGLTGRAPADRPAPKRRSLTYAISRVIHEAAFRPGTRRFEAAGRVVRSTQRVGLAPLLHAAEQAVKIPLYGCRDCGDCSLPDIAFLCPQSQCAKNQRNGPCGGSTDGECEVPGKDCIWARAYDRLAARGLAASMLDRPVAVADNALAHTSSWASALTGQDLHARREEIVPSPVAPPPERRDQIALLADGHRDDRDRAWLTVAAPRHGEGDHAIRRWHGQ
jgi:methylenetetrahydrofolate reductase (NADPH)